MLRFRSVRIRLSGRPIHSSNLPMPLIVAQANHEAKVFPGCRAEMTEFLGAGAEVVIHKQDDCGSDLPPYAIVVVGTTLWIDGCETPGKQQRCSFS
jgi:hypothetical protein